MHATWVENGVPTAARPGLRRALHRSGSACICVRVCVCVFVPLFGRIHHGLSVRNVWELVGGTSYCHLCLYVSARIVRREFGAVSFMLPYHQIILCVQKRALVSPIQLHVILMSFMPCVGLALLRVQMNSANQIQKVTMILNIIFTAAAAVV